jgi:fructokinase
MKVEVVCFGEILWDVFEAGPRGKEPVARLFRRELGGAPANVATGLARLGVGSAVVGGVGQDRLGDALLAHLRGDRVETRFVVQLPNRTGLTFVTRDVRGEPDFLFYRHESADMALRPKHVVPAMGRARWALVGTSTLVHAPLAEATHAFVRAAKRGGARLFVDLNVRSHLWQDARQMRTLIAGLVRHAALVKASDADLRAVAGPRGLEWLEEHAPKASWLVTRGAGAATAIGPHGVVNVPARRARCVDATGAGDAFIAGSLATLLACGAVPGSKAWTDARVWREVLSAGHVLGAKAIGSVGAVSGLDGLKEVRARIDKLRGIFR